MQSDKGQACWSEGKIDSGSWGELGHGEVRASQGFQLLRTQERQYVIRAEHHHSRKREVKE